MRYAAFLRAINVGTNNRIKMAELKALCANAGLENISTYLQSGNLVFDFQGTETAAAGAIEGALAGYGLKNTPAIVRTLPELESVMASEAFAGHPIETHLQYVTLFKEPLPASAKDLAHDLIQVVAVGEREVFSAIQRGGPPGADVNGFLSKAAKLQGTTRYWHVVGEMTSLLRGV